MTTGTGPVVRKSAVAAVFLLSLLWALDGLGPDLLPALRHSQMPGMERQAITYGLAALVAGGYAWKRHSQLPSLRSTIDWSGVGLLLFVAPVILSMVAQSWVSQLERVAIFSLAPMFAVVLEPHLGTGQQRSNVALIAALAAVAGALCIFPLDLPGTPVAGAAVLAVVLAAASAAIGNCVAVRFAHCNSDGSLAWCAALAASSAALAFAAAGGFTERAQWQIAANVAELVWLVLVDVPALFLLFWLLPQISATRMTTRFILAPLLTVLLGIVLEQPGITARIVLGIILMAAGSLWLLLASDEDADEGRIGIR